MSAQTRILVCSERADVSAELLAIGRALAGSDGPVVSLAVGGDPDARATEEIAHGADGVLILASGIPFPIAPSLLLEALARAVEAVEPSVVLVGCTRTGAEAAPRLAQRLRVACASECIALELDDAGDLVVDRFVYGGRFISRQLLRSTPRIATVQVKRFEPLAPDSSRQGDIRVLPVELPASAAKLVGVKERERSQVDIGKAEIIVAAGRGVREKEDLAMLETLADTLRGEIAGSRPLVEAQWFPRDRQVGLSGQTVKPRLYVACGISGQIEHIAGMRSAGTVVAINTSAEAPIHREADYSVVGDLYQIVPALVRVIAESKAPGGVGPVGEGAG